MKRQYSPSQTLFLAANGAISSSLQSLWELKNRNSNSVSSDAKYRVDLMRLWGLVGAVIFLLGYQGALVVWFKPELWTDFASPSGSRLFWSAVACTILGAAVILGTWVTIWRAFEFGQDLKKLVDAFNTSPGALAHLLAEDVKVLIHDKLVNQVRVFEIAEADMKKKPDSWTAIEGAKIHRDKLREMYRAAGRFGLVDSTLGWDPFFDAAHENQAAQSAVPAVAVREST